MNRFRSNNATREPKRFTSIRKAKKAYKRRMWFDPKRQVRISLNVKRPLIGGNSLYRVYFTDSVLHKKWVD